MTRLEANVKDFHVKENEQDKIISWFFRFGKCEDFHDAMKQFKERIAFEDRMPNPDANWLWEVIASAENKNAMQDIFDNFSECLQIVESQMKLFK